MQKTHLMPFLVSFGATILLLIRLDCPAARAQTQPSGKPKVPSAGRTVNERRLSGALLRAASQEDPVLILSLLDQGANVNARDKEGQTALMKAATYGLGKSDYEDFASQGDVNKRAPLYKAMKLLLDRGARVNARDHRGQTALMLTAEYAQSPACIRLLLSRGADIHLRGKSGGRAVDYARWGGTDRIGDLDNHEVIKILK